MPKPQYLVSLLAGLALFMIPTIVAFRRSHPNRWAIAIVNIVFGGTSLGWLGSLVWAFNAVHKSPIGSHGGESGLNLFVNDPILVQPMPTVASLSDQDQVAESLKRLKNLRNRGAISPD